MVSNKTYVSNGKKRSVYKMDFFITTKNYPLAVMYQCIARAKGIISYSLSIALLPKMKIEKCITLSTKKEN